MAIQKTDGKVLRSQGLDLDEMYFHPVLADRSHVYVRGVVAKYLPNKILPYVVALSRSNFRELWRYRVASQIDLSHVVLDARGKRVFVGLQSGRLVALDSASGKVVGQRDLSQPCFGLWEDSGHLVWAAAAGIQALDMQNLRTLWQTNIPLSTNGPVRGHYAVARPYPLQIEGNWIYFLTTTPCRIVALDRKAGLIRWVHPVSNNVDPRAFAATTAGVVYGTRPDVTNIFDHALDLHWLRGSDGKIDGVFRCQVFSDFAESSLTAIGDSLVVAEDDALTCLGPNTKL